MTPLRWTIPTMKSCARLSGQPVDAVLLYSAKAAAAMQTLTERPALHRSL